MRNVWLMAWVGCVATAACAAAGETRGVWLQPYAITDEARPATLEKIEKLGINAVFLRTPTVGHNRGWGSEADFTATLTALSERGVAVHAWITNKLRRGDPQAAKAQADFTDPDERTAQAAWAVAILDKWPALAGVHLDYIRYSDWEAPDAKKIGAVTQTVRSIRAALREKHPGKQLTAAVFTADYSYLGGRWGDGKTNQWDGDIPKWYAQWYAANPGNMYETRPKSEHAAGRFKDYGEKILYGPTFFHVQQDPVTWLREGLVDSIQIMQYTSDRGRWRAEADAWKAFMGDDVGRVVIGLGWLVEDGQPDWGHDAEALADHVRYGREVGIGGWSVFTLGVRGVEDGEFVEALAPLVEAERRAEPAR